MKASAHSNKNDDGDDVSQPNHPIRTTKNLYTAKQTYHCATLSKCKVCAYKIGCFDVKRQPQRQKETNENEEGDKEVKEPIIIKVRDEEFVKKCPNARPESCPRFSSSPPEDDNDQEEKGGYYKPGMNILTIGDGDLSFSLALSRKIIHNEEKKGRLICTSYESKTTLQEVYSSSHINDTISELESKEEEGVNVCYNVDATKLEDTLPSTIYKQFTSSTATAMKLHRIIWNFPCIAISNGHDGQKSELNENIKMVQSFLQNAIPLLHPTQGEVHICHKTKPPFDIWNMEDILTTEGGKDNELEYKGRIVFDRCLYKPYTPRKALDCKSFPCHDACVYVFGFSNDKKAEEENDEKRKQECKKEGEKDKQEIFFSPTIPTVAANLENDDSISNTYDKNEYGIIPVTNKMITDIRKLHLLLASSPLLSCHDAHHKKKKKQNKRKQFNSEYNSLVNKNGKGAAAQTKRGKKKKRKSH